MSEDRLRRLMARARLESGPPVDVTRRVAAALRAQRYEERVAIAQLAWIAAASAAVAVPATLASLAAWELLTDPLLGLASSLVWWAL